MEEGSVAVLVDAKEEYTKQLISMLKSCMYQGIKSIYLDAKDICNQDNTPENVLMVFQDLLSRIPKWSQEIINKEYQRIIDATKCDYIEDLLKVVYVSHIKILTIVHSAQKNKKISLKVPSGGHFLHLCYIECAREFWKNPYLFSDRVSKYDHQKNMRDSETMISECVAETIRKQLPVRHILKEYLNEPDEDVKEEEDEDIKNPINKKYLKRLETMVKKELAILAKEDSAKEAKSEDADTKAVRETIKNLDEDVIRKIIKEEMDSRVKEGTVSTSTVTPKKELVNDVVEKIIEQVEEQVEEQKVEQSCDTVTAVATTIAVAAVTDSIVSNKEDSPADNSTQTTETNTTNTTNITDITTTDKITTDKKYESSESTKTI
jgi:hypothetical protein